MLNILKRSEFLGTVIGLKTMEFLLNWNLSNAENSTKLGSPTEKYLLD